MKAANGVNQHRILQFLTGCGYSPSVREIGAEVGLKSPATVQFHLGNLERAGLIERVGPHRRIRVPQ